MALHRNPLRHSVPVGFIVRHHKYNSRTSMADTRVQLEVED